MSACSHHYTFLGALINVLSSQRCLSDHHNRRCLMYGNSYHDVYRKQAPVARVVASFWALTCVRMAKPALLTCLLRASPVYMTPLLCPTSGSQLLAWLRPYVCPSRENLINLAFCGFLAQRLYQILPLLRPTLYKFAIYLDHPARC